MQVPSPLPLLDVVSQMETVVCIVAQYHRSHDSMEINTGSNEKRLCSRDLFLITYTG